MLSLTHVDMPMLYVGLNHADMTLGNVPGSYHVLSVLTLIAAYVKQSQTRVLSCLDY